MKLAAIQYRPPKAEPDRARAELCALIDDAGAQGAGLIVCPEMATTGYIWESPAEIGPHTEEARGPTFQQLSGLAIRHRAWIVCGFAERFVHVRPGASGSRVASLYNSALVVTPAGELATCYRKVLLYEADRTWANPGWRRPVCRASFGRMVPAICMDLNDPRFLMHLHETQPQVVAFCTNWVAEGLPVHPYWQERLGGWQGWLVAANTWGADRGTRFSGESAIFNPDGEVVAAAPATGDHVLVAEAPDLVPGLGFSPTASLGMLH